MLSGRIDAKSGTIAALAFWKVCQYSEKYSKGFSLSDICESHEKMLEKREKFSVIYQHFDVAADNVKRVFKTYLEDDFEENFLPKWEGRIAYEGDD